MMVLDIHVIAAPTPARPGLVLYVTNCGWRYVWVRSYR
jgi:hypothetical protein